MLRTEKALYVEITAMIIMVVIFGIATYQRNTIWKDGLTLWHDTVTKSPVKARPHNYLGISYKSKGFLDKAIEHYQISIRLAPTYSEPYNNIGICYFEKGEIDQAILAFQKTISINYKNAEAHL